MSKKYLIIFCIVVIIFIFLYSQFIEPNKIAISELAITTDNHLSPAEQIKMVFLSDLHMREFGSFERRVAKRVNEEKPDIIVITGDFLHTVKLLLSDNTEKLNFVMDELDKFLQSLEAPLGIVAVRGNYEIVIQKELSDLVLEHLRDAGITVLCNQSTSFELGENSFTLIGVDFHDFPKTSIADFKIGVKNGPVMEAGRSKDNAYSHFITRDSNKWRNFEYSGRMMYSDSPSCGIGVTFYSQFGDGYDKFYRVRWWTELSSFYLDSHGIEFTPISTGVRPVPDCWYHFTIMTETCEKHTLLRVKIWPDGDPEPRDWQAELIDESAQRLREGTIGLWSWGEGNKYFDDLKVTQPKADKLLFAEDFNSYSHGTDPKYWLDYGIDAEGLRIAAEGIRNEELTILLSHSPDLVHEAEKHGIDVILSGHTHGGQIRLPGIGALVSSAKLGRKYTAGRFDFNNTLLYINRGIGTVALPFRLFCPPEITVIHIQ